jgi:hypothetical protein
MLNNSGTGRHELKFFAHIGADTMQFVLATVAYLIAGGNVMLNYNSTTRTYAIKK